LAVDVCRRANGQCRYRHVTPGEFESEQLQCAMAELTAPEEADAARMTGVNVNNVYRKRKAPSSVDNDDADDDDDDERIYLNNNNDSTAAAIFKQSPAAMYLAPAYNNSNNFRFGCQAMFDDATQFFGGNNFRLVQPVLPVAILPSSAPLGVLATVRSPVGLCDYIRVFDRTSPSVVPATVAVGTNVICPVPQWL